MRGPVKNRNIRKPDAKYQSVEVSTLINYVMWSGKKTIATTVVYDALDIIKTKLKVEDPMETYKEALRNAGPIMEIRSRRVGGANYQVPREVRPERRVFLALRWIIDAAHKKKGKGMAEKLAEELLAAYKNEGAAMKKKLDMHRMAEANRAFAHFAR